MAWRSEPLEAPGLGYRSQQQQNTLDIKLALWALRTSTQSPAGDRRLACGRDKLLSALLFHAFCSKRCSCCSEYHSGDSGGDGGKYLNCHLARDATASLLFTALASMGTCNPWQPEISPVTSACGHESRHSGAPESPKPSGTLGTEENVSVIQRRVCKSQDF
ncbi:hypothetical protein EYF80_029199 [Liparis tanakae]|uniref:Uncharacterized protein n=1 Tax=Liparis tanakae TaxID=230148 RepID=A0A4Z2H420_9TELE|nr:hypothetical protein EYF80_029199 [Liparis tanakae]